MTNITTFEIDEDVDQEQAMRDMVLAEHTEGRSFNHEHKHKNIKQKAEVDLSKITFAGKLAYMINGEAEKEVESLLAKVAASRHSITLSDNEIFESAKQLIQTGCFTTTSFRFCLNLLQWQYVHRQFIYDKFKTLNQIEREQVASMVLIVSESWKNFDDEWRVNLRKAGLSIAFASECSNGIIASFRFLRQLTPAERGGYVYYNKRQFHKAPQIDETLQLFFEITKTNSNKSKVGNKIKRSDNKEKLAVSVCEEDDDNAMITQLIECLEEVPNVT